MHWFCDDIPHIIPHFTKGSLEGMERNIKNCDDIYINNSIPFLKPATFLHFSGDEAKQGSADAEDEARIRSSSRTGTS